MLGLLCRGVNGTGGQVSRSDHAAQKNPEEKEPGKQTRASQHEDWRDLR